jgi:hypothetical protein
MPRPLRDLAPARARSQGLLESRLSGVDEVVRRVVGVQAQDRAAGALSIRVRSSGLTRADVERALVEERSVVRLWAMRGTIHLVPAEDAAWLVELFAPLVLPRSQRRLEQLGVAEADRRRALALIRSTLADRGPLTRAELMEPLARAGIATDGQIAAHLPLLAALEGHVCFGPDRGGKPTLVLRDDWLGTDLPRLPRAEATAELAHRYARAFGPAEADDFAAWSGLGLREARAAWPKAASEPAPVAVPERPVTRLLPAFDTYLLGYRSRDFAVPAEHARKVWPGGGIVRPTVIENGRAVAVWKRSGTTIEIEPFDSDAIAGEDEVADIQRFLGARPARARSSRE